MLSKSSTLTNEALCGSQGKYAFDRKEGACCLNQLARAVRLFLCSVTVRWQDTIMSSSSRKAVGHDEQVLLFLDQIKREKGVWWMPWQ